MLNVPTPFIAGVVIGTAAHFELLEKTRKLLRRWTIVKKQNQVVSIRSKFKMHYLRSLMKENERNSARRRSSLSVSSLLDRLIEGSTLTKNEILDTDLTERNRDVERVLDICGVKKDVKFSCAVPFWKQKSAKKIAEGSYGEIYSFEHVDGTRRIFKCIPIGGQHPMCTYRNLPLMMAVPDIVCSKCLSDLSEGSVYVAPNFPIIYSVSLVRDRFPELLMRSWWDYKNSPQRLRDPVGHPQPDMYPEQQLYLTIESSFGGVPLTKKVLQNAWLGVSIMTQITAALAVAEAACNFEHRDLHLGNILVKNTDVVSLKYTIQNCHFSVETIGYHVSIIDFTLSRIYHDGKVYFIGLDETASQNCDSQEYEENNIWLEHTNIYKIMAKYSRGMWDRYIPVTNLFWLKYLSETILKYLESNNPNLTKLVSPFDECNQMRAMRLLRKWNDSVTRYKSAKDFLDNAILQDDNPSVSVYKQR